MRRGSDRSGLVSKSPMWWPPSKVAGRYLTPFLAAEAGYDTDSQSLEERPAAGGDPTEATAERDDVVSFALSLADADADAREFHGPCDGWKWWRISSSSCRPGTKRSGRRGGPLAH